MAFGGFSQGRPLMSIAKATMARGEVAVAVSRSPGDKNLKVDNNLGRVCTRYAYVSLPPPETLEKRIRGGWTTS